MIATFSTMPQTKESSISRTPSLASGLDAFGLSNQAQSLARSGDLVGAERLHLQALDIKIKGFGFQSPQVASTLHSLAEVRSRLGKFSDAEQNLRSAISIRTSSSKLYDLLEAAKSRELLAQILETTGNLSSAKTVRFSGQPDYWIACGNSKVTPFFPFRTCERAFDCLRSARVNASASNN
jgi:Tetratricopeptide repeat